MAKYIFTSTVEIEAEGEAKLCKGRKEKDEFIEVLQAARAYVLRRKIMGLVAGVLGPKKD